MNALIYYLKRIGLGLLAMIAVSIGLTSIPPVFPFTPVDDQFFMSQPIQTKEQSLKIGLAAFIGAYVARVPFVVIAIAYYASATVYVFYILTLIAAPVEAVSIFEVTARNAIGTGFGLLAVVAGANLGIRFGRSQSGNVAEVH